MMKRVLVATAAAGILGGSGISRAEDKGKYEVNGYWRLGFNTSPTYLEDASDTQGYGQSGDLKTSRHTRNPSYFWLQMKRTFENASEAVVKVDKESKLPHENGTWDDPKANILRVRDLYYSMPVSADTSIWAGARTLEFEDIRIFDYLNYFNVNAHGVGLKTGNTQVVASFQREGVDNAKLQYSDSTGSKTAAPKPASTSDADVSYRRNLTLLVRHEMALGSNMAIKPMLKIDNYGSMPEDKKNSPAITRDKVKGATGYSVGGVLSRWDKSFWENIHFWLGVKPQDTLGVETGNDLEYGFGESGSWDFGSFGIMTGLWAQQEKFKTDKQVYKIEDEKLVADGSNKANTTNKLSLAVQPMYYVTDKVHTGVDLSAAQKTVKLSKDDFNCLLVTPIVRYAANKNPMGTPQIYTSVTYGMYDWKAKTNPNGEGSRRLVTAQTGFETWF